MKGMEGLDQCPEATDCQQIFVGISHGSHMLPTLKEKPLEFGFLLTRRMSTVGWPLSVCLFRWGIWVEIIGRKLPMRPPGNGDTHRSLLRREWQAPAQMGLRVYCCFVLFSYVTEAKKPPDVYSWHFHHTASFRCHNGITWGCYFQNSVGKWFLRERGQAPYAAKLL